MRELVGLVVASLALAGCASPPVQPSGGDPTPHAASAAEFVAAQRARVGMLRDFASRGSGEIHFRDDTGMHHEQAQVELAWREGGGRLALRMDKLGERFAWSGADPDRWWMFQLEPRPVRLTIGPRDQPPPEDLLGFIGPDSILELLGVTAWPESAVIETPSPRTHWLRWRRDRPVGVWVATRVRVDRPGAVPGEVQLLGADGRVLAEASHQRSLSVQIVGAPPGAWPEVAGTSRFRRPDRPDSSLEVFWDAPGTSPERLKDRLFDLQVLREVLRPAEIRDLHLEGRR